MKTVLPILLFCLLCLPVRSATVSGQVTNSSTNKPIEGVTVFLDGTTIGTYSRADGSFSLFYPGEMSVKVIASYVGFETKVYNYTPSAQDGKLAIHLKTKTIRLQEVSVMGKDPHRSDNLQLLRAGLFGNSEAGWQCKILNPEVLSFKRDKDKNGVLLLSAYADQPIRIENKELGYQVNYTLDSFAVNSTNITFLGHPFYIDKYQGVKVPRSIQKAREKAYQGSAMHFFRSLYANTLSQEGFKTFFIDVLTDSDNPMYQPTYIKSLPFTREANSHISQTENPVDLYCFTTIGKEFASLCLTEPFEVRYTKNSEEYDYRLYHPFMNMFKTQAKQQTTLVRLINDDIYFLENGIILNPAQMATIGYWSFKRLGDFLPSNYIPQSETVVKH